MSGATRCSYCTLFHTQAAKLFGATDEEIREAAAMAVDHDTFRRETLDAIAYVRSHTPQPQASSSSSRAHA